MLDFSHSQVRDYQVVAGSTGWLQYEVTVVTSVSQSFASPVYACVIVPLVDRRGHHPILMATIINDCDSYYLSNYFPNTIIPLNLWWWPPITLQQRNCFFLSRLHMESLLSASRIPRRCSVHCFAAFIFAPTHYSTVSLWWLPYSIASHWSALEFYGGPLL